jgi:uncharacterized protein YgbK (DUF1537 family)
VAALASMPAVVAPPPPSGETGVLVICGSFVPLSTAQIERLGARRPESMIPVDVAALAGAQAEREVERAVGQARTKLASGGLAVVVTDRERNPALIGVGAQQRVASALARVASEVRAGVVIAKGGITSAITAREGLGARVARVLGPLLPGVALWRLDVGVDYLVVPGNVGDADLLVNLLSMIVR